MNNAMQTGLRALLFGATALAAAPSALAETLADAMAKAYVNTPSLAANRAALRALDEREFRERAARLGAVDATAFYGYNRVDGASRALTGSSANDGDPLSLGVQGSIPIYDGGRIVNGTQAAQQGVLVGRADLIATEQDVLLAAVTAYEDVRRDIGLAEVSRSNVRVISEQLRAAQDRFEVGEVTRTDVAQAEARLAAARSTLAAVTGQLARSRQAYLVAIGELPEDLQPPPPLPQLPADESAAIALAEAGHPSLQGARFAVRQAEFEVKRAIGAILPTVSLEADAAYDNNGVINDNRGRGEQTSFTVGVQGRLPLWTGGRNQSGVREAQARVAQAMAQVQDVAREIRRQVSNSWSGLVVSRQSIVAAKEQIRAAQIAFDGVREEATLGARTTLDVLDADQELQNARADLIQALRDEYVAGYSLLSAVGSLTVLHLGLDVDRYDPDAYRARVRQDGNTYPRDASTEWTMQLRP